MKRSVIETRLVVAGATLSAAALLALVWLLWTLSMPAQADQRLAAVQTRLQHAEAVLKAGAELDRYPPAAICEGVGGGPAAGRNLVEGAAGKAGVVLVEDRIATAGAAPGPMLAAFSLDVTAKGQEPALTGFLRRLAGSQPLIIADGVDMGSDGAEVTLHVKGRFLCHDRRLP